MSKTSMTDRPLNKQLVDDILAKEGLAAKDVYEATVEKGLDGRTIKKEEMKMAKSTYYAAFERPPSRGTLRHIAEMLHVDPPDLLSGGYTFEQLKRTVENGVGVYRLPEDADQAADVLRPVYWHKRFQADRFIGRESLAKRIVEAVGVVPPIGR